MRSALYLVLAVVALGNTGCCFMDHMTQGCGSGGCGERRWGCGPWGGSRETQSDCGNCGNCDRCRLLQGRIRDRLHGQHGCASGHCNNYPRGAGGPELGMAGPPTGAVTYPYYTNRGPRDFLDPNPASIGP